MWTNVHSHSCVFFVLAVICHGANTINNLSLYNLAFAVDNIDKSENVALLKLLT